MKQFFRKGGQLCYFALKLPDGSVRMVSMSRIDTLIGRGKKRISEADMAKETWLLEDWLEASATWAEDV
jgi:hypothetical protein